MGLLCNYDESALTPGSPRVGWDTAPHRGQSVTRLALRVEHPDPHQQEADDGGEGVGADQRAQFGEVRGAGIDQAGHGQGERAQQQADQERDPALDLVLEPVTPKVKRRLAAVLAIAVAKSASALATTAGASCRSTRYSAR
jgi:hypothetical protein